MHERAGCDLLRARFVAAGLEIVDDFRFAEGGVEVTLDGFDPARRVGYEYLTTEAGDRAEFTPAVMDVLEARVAAGDLSLLIVDEVGCDEATLDEAATRFLAELRQRGRLP